MCLLSLCVAVKMLWQWCDLTDADRVRTAPAVCPPPLTLHNTTQHNTERTDFFFLLFAIMLLSHQTTLLSIAGCDFAIWNEDKM